MKTNLITREGYDLLQQELDQLWRHERPEVTRKVTWAAALVIVLKMLIINTIKSA